MLLRTHLTGKSMTLSLSVLLELKFRPLRELNSKASSSASNSVHSLTSEHRPKSRFALGEMGFNTSSVKVEFCIRSHCWCPHKGMIGAIVNVIAFQMKNR